MNQVVCILIDCFLGGTFFSGAPPSKDYACTGTNCYIFAQMYFFEQKYAR